MKIGIIGATGRAGRLIAKEAYDRGHQVTAIVIDPEHIDNRNYTVLNKNVFDLTVDDVKGFDAVINCFGVFDPAKLIQHQTSMMTLISIFEQLPDVRFLMVGGAASLYTDETKTQLVLDTIPADWAGVPTNMKAAFENLKKSKVNWTYFSPAGTFDPDGGRSGSYILGDDDVLTLNEDGESYISYADYAIAMIDELENNKYAGGKRITAAAKHVPKEEKLFCAKKVGIIGATGKAGRLIAREAYGRGHQVTAIVIDPENLDNPNYAVIHKSIFDLTADDLKDFDVVINCFGVFNPAKLIQHQTTMTTLISIFEQLPNVRFMMIGGAASLYTDESKTKLVLETIPADWAGVPTNMKAAFENLKQSSVANWTYFSPAGTFDPNGGRTGKYTIGDNDVAIPNEDGESYISYADYAVAMVDEMENENYTGGKRITAVSKKASPEECSKKVAVIGATGRAGRLIAREIYGRGHQITAIVVDPENLDNPNYAVLNKSIFDLTVDDLKDFDVIVNCFGAWAGKEIQYQTSMTTMISILKQLPNVRYMMIGGAASLYTDESKTKRVLETIPAAYAEVPKNAFKAFENLLESGLDNWLYFSPAGFFDPDGARTGKYVINDNDVAILNDSGESYISYADFAVAMADEMEQHNYKGGKRITAVSKHIAKE
jgi:putative NADH-flavin reductase